METITGVVRGPGGPVALDVTLEAKKKTHRAEPVRSTFVLETDEGEVEIRTSEDTELVPEEKQSGTWGSLASSPLARAVRDRAPGDHVKVSLRGVVVASGDRVTVRGEVVDRERSDAYRGGPTGRVTVLQATLIGCGDDGAEVIAERDREAAKRASEAVERPAAPRPKKEPSPPLALDTAVVLGVAGVALVGVMGSMVAVDAGPRWVRPLALTLGIAALTLAIFTWRRRRWLPVFRESRKSRGQGLPWAVSGFAFTYEATLAIGLGLTLFQLLGAGLASGAVLMALVPCVGTLVAAIWLAVVDRGSARVLRLLLTSRRAGARDGSWGLYEGTLREGSLSATRRFVSRSSTRTESYKDSSGNMQTREVTRSWYEWNESSGGTSAGALELANGVRVSLDLRGATWASTSREVTLGDEPSYREDAKSGHRVLVLGRITQEGDALAIRATGPESLVLLATGEHDAPRAAALRLWAAHWTGVIALVAIALVGGAVGWWNVYQTHRVLEGTVTSSSHPGVAVGDTCVLDVGYHEDETSGHRCQVHLRCGWRTMYGSGLAGGFMGCDVLPTDVRGSDSDPNDGDEAITFDATYARAWNDDDESVTVHFGR